MKASLLVELNAQKNAINRWFQRAWQGLSPPFYASVDLRYSGPRLVPVDVNLYPAGFNNLSLRDENTVAEQMRMLLMQANASCKNILIITENHTRNAYYLAHLSSLQSLLIKAGFTVRLSMLSQEPHVLQSPSGDALSFERVLKEKRHISVGAWVPDCIILNHDLSEGLPALLENIEQPVLPSPKLGWWKRRKSLYFEQYNKVCQTFCKHFSWDPWWFSANFDKAINIDFNNIDASSALFTKAENVLKTATQKYRDYSLTSDPYLVIKADAGTYGMGVLIVNNVEQLKHLSRKNRQRMLKTKGSQSIGNVIIQEGIPSITTVDGGVAEPVVYCVGSNPIGGFYRSHQNKNAHDNLNTPGMVFTPFREAGSIEKFAYYVVARLAVLAAGKEMQLMND